MVITFEELRSLKDSMPAGSIKKIAEELGIDADTVRNYFGGDHYERNPSFSGVHFEKGAAGGVVEIENPEILNAARRIVAEAKANT
jgi:predicted transcriptional regulator